MKRILKFFLRLFSWFLVLPFVLSYKVSSLFQEPREALQGPSQFLSQVPGKMGVYMRGAFYCQVLKKCGEELCISYGALVVDPESELGDRVYIGPYSIIGRASIGQDVVIASQVSVISGFRQHSLEEPERAIVEKPGHFERITIGENSWIGEKATVGASVGQFSVVGAGSVVTRPVPDKIIVAGNPAKKIKERQFDN